ncbi:hypothetical protein MKW92_039308, partial [Papaver armeniacum]
NRKQIKYSMIAAGNSSKCTQLIFKHLKFFTSERAAIAVTRPSHMNAPNPLQTDLSATTFFMVLMGMMRDVTKVIPSQLQVESFAFEVLLPECNRTLDDIAVSEGVARGANHTVQWFTGLDIECNELLLCLGVCTNYYLYRPPGAVSPILVLPLISSLRTRMVWRGW